MAFFSWLFNKKLKNKLNENPVTNTTITASSEADGGQVTMHGYINANVLNVRSQPVKAENILGRLSRDTQVNIIDKQTNAEGAWFRIKYNNKDGYIAAQFVNFRTGFVNANALYMRKAPNKDGEILGKLQRNDTVTILQNLTGWYKIEHKGTQAFMSSDYIKIGTQNQKPADDEKPAKEFLKDNQALLRVKLEPRSKLIVPTASREGKISAQIYNEFGGLLDQLCSEIKIDIATAIAVMSVESGGKGFGNEGNVLIRFENHLFYSFWGKFNERIYNQHFRFSSGERWKNHFFRKDKNSEWEAFHGNQAKEWEVLNFARSLDNENALKSASYGLPQVIGSNHKVIGYNSAQEMVDNFSKDIRYHVLGLFDFFNPQMIKHLQKKEFTDFARYYNGSGQATRYGGFIKRYYDAFKKLK